MKKLATLLLLTTAFSNAHAVWDFSLKGDLQRAFTDNVNLTNTDPISDNFTILSGYAQARDDIWRLRLKGKVEKYSKQLENDNYSTDLSLQYKRTKNNDYTFAVFKQVYNGTPLVSTDSTSDNSGARLTANFTHDFKNTTQGYFAVGGTIKNYSKIDGRKDTLLNLALGFEHSFAKTWLVAPELSFAHNGSADDYYSNNSYGPGVLLSYIPDDTWELFLSGGYTRTTYSGRTVTRTVRNNKTVTEKEYQELFSTDLGAIYSFPQYISLTAKYSNSSNSSNNTTSAYKASIFYLGAGIKF